MICTLSLHHHPSPFTITPLPSPSPLSLHHHPSPFTITPLPSPSPLSLIITPLPHHHPSPFTITPLPSPSPLSLHHHPSPSPSPLSLTVTHSQTIPPHPFSPPARSMREATSTECRSFRGYVCVDTFMSPGGYRGSGHQTYGLIKSPWD